MLQPLARRAVGHWVSIYFDGVVLFSTSTADDLNLIKTMLQKFGIASGLHTNMAKSSIVPIRCEGDEVEAARVVMGCTTATFPCKYLGLPLSIRKLTKADLQAIVDKVVDRLPSWKAALMARYGRLILVKAVLTAIPIYLLIALDVPKWVIKAIDK